MISKDALLRKIKIKQPRSIYILYWFLLSYILAALLFWFIVLNKQNTAISQYRLDMIDVDDASHDEKEIKINHEKSVNTAQYIGEGITFLLLIGAGAIFVFKAIEKQFRQSEQQENFMMAITHELKTPIAIAKLNLETLQKRLLNPEQQEKLISSTIQEANRLNLLCNNMLLANQIEAGKYRLTEETVNLTQLAAECAHDFIVRFPFRKIKTELNEEIFIECDLLLLQLAVNNLLDNAIKYSAKEDLVLVKIFTNTNGIHLQVIDEGAGISENDKEKIFEKFYRGSKEKAKGTGLGLFLTKKIVQAHRGKIKMTSNSPKGSIFEIILQPIKFDN